MAKTASGMSAYRAQKAGKGSSGGTRTVAESLTRLQNIGNGVELSPGSREAAEKLGAQYVGDIADVIEEMEGKYGVFSTATGSVSTTTVVFGEPEPGRGKPRINFEKMASTTNASMSYYPGSRLTRLNVKANTDYETFNKGKADSMASGWSAPWDTKKRSGLQATMVHEYGHAYGNMLAYNHNANTGKRMTAFYKNSQKAILKIASEKYGAGIESASGYARTKPQQFFAEAFANANNGAPNAIGNAFNDWVATKIVDGKVKGQTTYKVKSY